MNGGGDPKDHSGTEEKGKGKAAEARQVLMGRRKRVGAMSSRKE